MKTGAAISFWRFFPKIPGLVRRYKPQYPFESYLTNAMQWYVKTFIEKAVNADHHESYALEEFTNQAIEVAEKAAKNFGFGQPWRKTTGLIRTNARSRWTVNGRLADPGLRRRILYVALHRAADIADSRLCRLARLTGVSKNWLLSKASESRRLTRESYDKRENSAREETNAGTSTTGPRAGHVRQHEPTDTRAGNIDRKPGTPGTRKAKRSAENLSVTPSHAEIGKMIGSPAGTVSSGFFFLRQLWSRMEQTGTPPGIHYGRRPDSGTGPAWVSSISWCTWKSFWPQTTPIKNLSLNSILKPHSIRLPADMGWNFDVEETGNSYLENALIKAGLCSNSRTDGPVVADDSGLSVPALGGEPGVHSARYGSTVLKPRLESGERNAYLLENMKMLERGKERRAFFVCCMVLISEDYRLFSVQETFNGLIAPEASGSGGFGYDPVFYLPELGKTVSELDDKEKNRISHRGRAGLRLKAILDSLDSTP